MDCNRRDFLLASLAGPMLSAARAQAAPLPQRSFARVTRLASGVYATIADTKRGLQCYSNGGLIVGKDAVLIIEGHFQPEGADLELEAARALSKAPLRGVVNTHYHLDHTFGNLGYSRRGVPILAHDQVGPLMKARYAPMSDATRREQLAPWEQRLRAAANPVDAAHRRGDLELFTWLFDAINGASLAFPTQALAPADLPQRIELGGLTAVIEFHRGHSPTDLIVKVPERDVVFTGDLFFNHALPVVPDADLLAWRRVVDRFTGYDRRTQFVPGHGPVGRIEDVRLQAVLMDDMRHHAERMKQMGATADEAESRYEVPQAFKDFEILSWTFTVGGAMRGYFDALK